jgi:hypothetical protein
MLAMAIFTDDAPWNEKRPTSQSAAPEGEGKKVVLVNNNNRVNGDHD